MANRKNHYSKVLNNEMRELFSKRFRIGESLELIKIIHTSTHTYSLALSFYPNFFHILPNLKHISSTPLPSFEFSEIVLEKLLFYRNK